MRAELLGPDAPRWTELLSSMRHDFYHLPEYLQFAVRRQETGEPLAFVAEEDGDRFFMPLIVREIPPNEVGEGPLFDATCPRGYPGPLVASNVAAEADAFVERAIQAAMDALRERRVVSAFVRLHPLLEPSLAPLSLAGDVVEHGATTWIDLTLPREDLWRQTNHGHRQGINRAIRGGYVARIDEDWESFDGFVAIYQESMKRLDSEPFWRFSRDYFRDLKAALSGHLHLCVVEIGGELACAALLTEVDGIVEFHLSATAEDHLRASPSKLLIDFARSWAKDRGNDRFHLTGSVRPGDALGAFKAGFSPLHHQVRSWRVITDRPTYDELVSGWRAKHGRYAKAVEGYFPAYRSPGPRPA